VAEIVRTGPYSGVPYRIKIAGDAPTADEQLRIDGFIRQRESERTARMAQRGIDITGGEGSGLTNQANELFKAIPRGAIGMAESAGLGLSAWLPEDMELGAREGIRKASLVAQSPFAPDIGLENSTMGQLGQGLGSFAPLVAASMVPGVGWGLAGLLAIGAGAGEASERARAAGATEAERNKATLGGAFVGAADLIPLGTLSRAVSPGAFSYIKRALTQGGVEGAQEAASEVAQNLIEQGIYNPEKGTFAGAPGAAGVGFSVGALVQSLVDAVTPGRRRGAQPPAAAEAPEEQPAATPPAGTITPPSELGLPAADAASLDAMLGTVQSGYKAGAPRQPMPTAKEVGITSASVDDLAAMLDNMAGPDAPAYAAARGASTTPTLNAGVYPAGSGLDVVTPPPVVAPSASPQVAPPVSETSTPQPVSPQVEADIGAAPKAPTRTKKAAKTVAQQDAGSPAETVAPPSLAAVEEVTAPEATQPSGPAPVSAPVPAPDVTPELLKQMEEVGLDTTAIRQAAEQTAQAVTTPTDQSVITTKTLDALGVPKGAAAYKATESGQPQKAIRKKLDAFIVQTKNKEAAQRVREYLGGPANPAEPGGGRVSLPSDTAGVGPDPVAQPRSGPANPSVPVAPQPGGVGASGNVSAPAPAAGVVQPGALTSRVTSPDPIMEQRAAPGVTTGTASQTIPRGVPPAPRRVAPEVDYAPTGEDPQADVMAKAELDAWRVQNVDADVMAFSRRIDNEINQAEDARGVSLGALPDVTTAQDKEKILELLKKPRKWNVNAKSRPRSVSEAEWAAGRYFLRHDDPTHALTLIAHDKVFGSEISRVDLDLRDLVSKSKAAAKRIMGQAYNAPEGLDSNSAEYKYHTKTGRKYATQAQKWIEENLSPEAQSYLRLEMNRNHRFLDRETGRPAANAAAEKIIREDFDPIAAESALREATEKAVRDRQYAEAVKSGYMAKKPKPVSLPKFPDRLMADLFNADSTMALRAPMHPAVTAALNNGDLVGALRALVATSQSSELARLAGAVIPFLDYTRVRVLREGDPLWDRFFTGERENYVGVHVFRHEADPRQPEDGTIFLRNDVLTAHALLHEAIHAVTGRVLDDRNHPTTRALQKLFDEMKPLVENEYGGKNLAEFVAEGLSNYAFRDLMASWKPKGQPVTGLQRFVRALTNTLRSLIGLVSKPPNAALDRFDQLAYAAISPSIDFYTAGGNLEAMYGKAGAAALMRRAVDRIVPFNDTHKKRVAMATLSDAVPDSIKSATMGLVPLRNLADMAKGYFPMAEKLNDVAQKQSGMVARLNDMVDASIKDVGHWLNKHRDLLDTFNDLRFTSTLEEVDPGKPRDRYEGDKQDIWDQLQPDWKKLGPEGQKAFKTLGGVFENLRKEAVAVLYERVHSSIGDRTKAKTVADQLYERVFAKKMIDPYAPLQREGKYWLQYDARDPRTGEVTLYKESFTSQSEREKAMGELQAVDPRYEVRNLTPYNNVREIYARGAPPTAFVQGVMKILDEGAVEDVVKSDILELVLDMSPERSFLQSFRAREGTRGFLGDITPRNADRKGDGYERKQHVGKHDAVAGTHGRAASMIRQLGRIRYGIQANTVRKELNEHYTAQQQRGTPGFTGSYAYHLYKELDERAATITHIDRANWSRALTGTGFAFTLGFNPSSALINLFALPTIVGSYLGPKYGYLQTARAMGNATKLFGASGRERTVEKINESGSVYTERATTSVLDYSLDNYDLTPGKNEPLQHYRFLLEEGKARGMFNRSQAYDLLELQESGGSASTTTMGQKFRLASGYIFHHSERFAREVTMITAYDMALQKKAGPNPISTLSPAQMREAALEAIYDTELTSGSISAAAAPRWAQSDLGAVVFLYKRYMLSMVGLQATLINRAFRNDNPEMRKIAKLQLATMYGSLGVFAGAAGTPLYGLIENIATIWDMFFGDDDDESFDTMVRTGMSELGYKGVVNYLSGREVASRIGLNDMFFRDQISDTDYPLLWDLAVQLGGPVIGIGVSVERGAKMIGDGEVQRGVEAMSPAFLRNLMRGIRYLAEGEATTLRGDIIVTDLNAGDAFLQAMGFAPAKYAYQLEMNSQYKQIDKAVADRRTKLMKKYYASLRNRDYSSARATHEDIREFNQRNPQYPIDPTDLRRSLKSHEETSRTMIGGVTYNPANRTMIQRLQREWDAPSIWEG
jgi:hypothetical protein